MTLELLQENLNAALTIASRIIASKPQLPILSHLLLEAEGGKLTLTSSNQEITTTIDVGAKITSSGKFTLPGRTLVEIVASLSAEKISLSLEGSVMALKAGGFKATINGSPAAEFPSLVPKDESKGAFWEMDKRTFTGLVERIVFSAASDEGRAVLTGVLFKSTGDNLEVAATDGFRLSVLNQKSSAKIPSDLIIPAKTLLEVARIASEIKEDDRIKIAVFGQSNQILFDLGAVKLYSALISGNFPDFAKIIPASSPIKLTLDADSLLRAVRLASVFARESANIVKLKIANSKLSISANAPQVGENESEVEAKIAGNNEDFSIAFNFHYLMDFLTAIGGSGEVTIEFSGPTAPGVFRSNSDPDFLHLIMPVRVQS